MKIIINRQSSWTRHTDCQSLLQGINSPTFQFTVYGIVSGIVFGPVTHFNDPLYIAALDEVKMISYWSNESRNFFMLYKVTLPTKDKQTISVC